MLKTKFNKTITRIFIAISTLVLLTHLFIEPLYTPTAISVNRTLYNFPQIIAGHSAISGEHQSNTLNAIQEALGSYIEGIEVDVKISKDQVLFLYQGDLLEDYTNGEGAPEDYDWSHLSELTYRDSSSSPIIKLEELFSIVGNQKAIFLNIHQTSTFNHKLAEKVTDLIKEHHLQERVFVKSFNPIFLIQMRLISREIHLVYGFIEGSTAATEEKLQYQLNKVPWLMKQPWIQKQMRRVIRPDVIAPQWSIDRKNLQKLIKAGYPVICWNVDEVEQAKLLYETGVIGLETTIPNAIQNIIPQTSKILYDAGGTQALLGEILNIFHEKDIVDAIKRAQKEKRKISIAGRRHSMGGQTLLKDSLQLNMLNFNQVKYNEKTQTITAQSGATWSKIQKIANSYGRSIKIMQSDNIFTVGGSVSVNVHGWQVASPPLSSSILSMHVITADGVTHYVSKDHNPELFRAVIGGYGLFATIIDVEIETTDNSPMKYYSYFIPSEELKEQYNTHVSKNPHVELAYARLSVDDDNLFKEAGLFLFEKQSEQLKQEDIQPEKLIAIKRGIFRLSQYHYMGKKLRWSAEKSYSKLIANSSNISRNDAMNTDIHILWPLYGQNKDILHEYFIPKDSLNEFLDAFRDNIRSHGINILNVTIREVKKDSISTLPYANEDVFALVCLFSQEIDDEKERVMEQFTTSTISLATKLGGTFYLPYRLHYSKENLLESYPNIESWIELKQQYDPKNIFDSNFYQYLQKLITGHSQT